MSGSDRDRQASMSAPMLDVAMQLRGATAAKLSNEAKRRRCDPGELATRLLAAVIADDLFAAVLDP